MITGPSPKFHETRDIFTCRMQDHFSLSESLQDYHSPMYRLAARRLLRSRK